MIVREFMLPPTRNDDAEDADADDGGAEAPPCDHFMSFFVPQNFVSDDGTRVLLCYTVNFNNPSQLDYIFSLLGAGISFSQITRVFQENQNRLGVAGKLCCVSEGDSSNIARITCALGRQMIAYLMSQSWAFSVATDVSQDYFGESHLDVRIRIPGRCVADDLLSFNLLEISLFQEAHSGASLFNILA